MRSAGSEVASRKAVLVAEDHRDTALLLGRLLPALGYDVTVAGGYRAALEAARSRRFDVLLADIDLGDGDGCELLAVLRSLHPLCPVKGVAMTGHGYPADRRRCEDAGFEVFLLKPVPFDRLREALMAVGAEAPDGPDRPDRRPEEPGTLRT
jgi:CheY-like chemotaxis protein